MSEHEPIPGTVPGNAPAVPVGIDMTVPPRVEAAPSQAPEGVEVAVGEDTPVETDIATDDAGDTGAAAPSAGMEPGIVDTHDSTPAGEAAPELDAGPPTLPKLDRLPRPQEARQIALINQKGGVGKTTTTVNLGAALVASGLRVLMVDLDPQAHLTLSLGIDPEELDLSIYELMTDSAVTASEVVRMVEGCPNLGVLPAVTNLAGVESEMAEMIATGLAQTVLRNKTADLVKQFDYVLLDCPPALGLLTINGLTAAKEIIVPMQAHFLALQGMGKLFETINMIRQGINPSLTVAGVVLCMHEANTILASDVVADVEGFFESARGTALPWADAEVYQPPIRRNIKLAEAPSFGQSVLTYAPDSNGAKDYAKLARSVAKAAV
ncbi:MAG: AAA family ATPase [Planctomycetota bacterium]